MFLFFGVLMSASRPDLKLHVFLLASVWPALCKATGKAVQLLNIILNSFGNQPMSPACFLNYYSSDSNVWIKYFFLQYKNEFLDKNQHSDVVYFTVNLKGKLGKEYSYTKGHNLYFNLENFLLIALSSTLVNKCSASNPWIM